MIASLPAFAVTAAGALVAAAVSGYLSPRAFLLPFGLVWLFLLTAGIVAIASALAVRFRDVLSALPFLLQVGLFLAPIGYPLADLGDTVRTLVSLNPLTGVIEAWRWMMLSGYEPSFESIGVSLGLTAFLAQLRLVGVLAHGSDDGGRHLAMSTLRANNNGGVPAVQADGLGKHYDLGELRSLPHFARRMICPGSAGRRPSIEALSGVDFSIHRGECFGMVGGNGCGKSTLLQILSGITLPSSGSMVVRGRVLPLLAVGTGFHPELTGSENVLLFGTTLGVPRRVILERIDQVAEFAELELHMDTPTKRFSVGMLARLSFATAVLFPADIYLFDEVLAVVDAEFQARCLREIKRISPSGGTVDLRQPRPRPGRRAVRPRDVARARLRASDRVDGRSLGCIPPRDRRGLDDALGNGRSASQTAQRHLEHVAERQRVRSERPAGPGIHSDHLRHLKAPPASIV